MLSIARSRFAVAVLHRALTPVFLAATLGFTVAAVAQQKPAEPAGKSPGNQALQNLDLGIDEVAEKVMPSIVQIDVTGFGPVDEDSGDTSVLSRQRALGSGVIVDPNGYIVTNAHVVSGANRIRVLLIPTNVTLEAHRTSLANRQRAYPAKLIGLNRNADLAVIKIEATDLPALKLQDLMSYKVRLGETVIAIGTPLGLDHTITRGIVSAVGRQPDSNKAMVYVQTDAPINPGNSGGALVDRDGNLVGINTFIYTKGGGSEGLGFAIPEPIVRHVYNEIREFGRVRQNYIGADVQTITADLAAGLGLGQDYGVIVSDVLAEGPADKGGLRTGDVITSFDGILTDSLPRFVSILYLHPTAAVRFDVPWLRKARIWKVCWKHCGIMMTQACGPVRLWPWANWATRKWLKIW